MALTLKLGSLDLSTYARLNPGDGFDPTDRDYLEPGFSDSPVGEGQALVSVDTRNKELVFPLWLKGANQTKQQAHVLIQRINRELATPNIMVEWQDDGASNSTFYDVEFGRVEQEFNYRAGVKGMVSLTLRVWVRPWGHNATALRTVATTAATGPLVAPAIPNSWDDPSAFWFGGNFEAPHGPGGWTATAVVAGGSVAIENASAYSGTSVLRLFTGGDNQGMSLSGASYFIPLASYIGNVYFTARVRAASPIVLAAAIVLADTERHTFTITPPATTGWFLATGVFAVASGFATAGLRLRRGTASSNTYWFDEMAVRAGTWPVMSTPSTIDGDVPAQTNAVITAGSAPALYGRVLAVSALPTITYKPIIPVSSFVNFGGVSGNIVGASGAHGSQAFEAALSAGNTAFGFNLPRTQAYAGDNRVLVSARVRMPVAMRALDPAGQPLGPTVVATSMDGFSLIDLGVARVATQAADQSYQVLAAPLTYTDAFPGTGATPPSNSGASGFPGDGYRTGFTASPAYTAQFGPVMVLPEKTTRWVRDTTSTPVAADGFDGAAGPLTTDYYGNAWNGNTIFTVTGSGYAAPVSSQGILNEPGKVLAVGDEVTDCEIRMNFWVNGASNGNLPGVGKTDGAHFVCFHPGTAGPYLAIPGVASIALASYIGSGNVRDYTLVYRQQGSTVTGLLYANSAPGISLFGGAVVQPASVGGNMSIDLSQPCITGDWLQASTVGSTGFRVGGFRAHALPGSQTMPRDVYGFNDTTKTYVRVSAGGVRTRELSPNLRGAQPNLGVPSPGPIAAICAPAEQGPMNDIIDFQLAVRERFNYAR